MVDFIQLCQWSVASLCLCLRLFVMIFMFAPEFFFRIDFSQPPSTPPIIFVFLCLCDCLLGWVDLGVLGKKCFDFFGLQETVSRNSYMTPGLYRYSLAQPAILPPAQHMRGTSKMGSFNLSVPKRVFDKQSIA